LQRDFLNTFKMTKENYENELLEFDGTLRNFYIQCESKYINLTAHLLFDVEDDHLK
jgi:hypothetical protein